MGSFKEADFGDRKNAAANAKKALLEKFRAKPGPDDPAVQERQAQRQAVSEAREARAAERKAAKVAAEAAEKSAREAAVKAEGERLAAEEAENEAEAARLKAEQKAARDARYAARKARK
ncbi:MAG: hypothetical protein H0T75_08600 [Rhizobiales bacterium]|jgi:hypothetical protein|nr:hypothetical protein [Hyphomicrobiales bacterium]MDQ3560020.1 DUF6481 family protein [Pseudomonadota bacterium]